VVTALGKTYHQACFRCAGCQKPFPAGERVTFTGKNCYCQICASAGANDNATQATSATTSTSATAATPASAATSASAAPAMTADLTSTTAAGSGLEGKCAGCGGELKDGQALMALDKHYHVWCFKCKACSTLLHGEYMGKDGQPYCEKCYQSHFGVKCSYCFRFISGKVLQAGDNNHFHPTCARCTKCGEPFGDGEEMFLQGAAIWHPRCGPSPEDDSGGNGQPLPNNVNGRASPFVSPYATAGVTEHADMDRQSTASEMPATSHGTPFHRSSHAYGSRASSPGASLRMPRGDPLHWRSTSQMAGSYAPSNGGHGHFSPAIYNSSSTYSLRRPLGAGDRTGSSSHLQHFHLPASRRSSSSVAGRHGRQPSVDTLSGVGGGGGTAGGFRPVSAPPKPGYTQRSSTLPSGATTPSGHFVARPVMANGGYDAVSQTSYRTDYSSDFMRGSNTYTHGFRPGSRATSAAPAPSGTTSMHPHLHGQQTTTVITEHKIYPVHLLFTSNYKLPPDVDRCNLEKHLNDEDFEMVFQMSSDEFYSMPLWRRNDFKRRVRLF